ncbi:hypothetical protein DOY81_009030, partial [Sarcophaga bullata]
MITYRQKIKKQHFLTLVWCIMQCKNTDQDIFMQVVLLTTFIQ